ncbi:MAG: helix-turn-helix transcriptional regulator [Methylobacteriaceae bacterium]|nr:helix-turn-helix transcriptional regulator [Methylobacteriaceae bacterium]
MGEQGAYGARIGEHFGVSSPPTLVANILRRSKLAITQLRCDVPDHGAATPIPPEKAFIVTMQLADLHSHELWIGGQRVPVSTFTRDSISALDLDCRPVWHLRSPFDFVQFYLPRAALDEIAHDNAAAPVDTLSIRPGVALLDPVAKQLASCLLPELKRPEQASRLFVDHVALALAVHFAQTYGGMRVAQRPTRGGLAPWQERRAKQYMMASLRGDISLSEMAAECSLSPSHFARAFRQTTGQPPHRWLLERRVEHAKELLRCSATTLADAALACGFSDQSHFTRIFSQVVGVSPGAWRRSEGHGRWMDAPATRRCASVEMPAFA